MQIAKELAGFSPAEAETLRKAIGKKIHELMASLKDKFLEGCAENDVAPAVAQQLWKDMESSQDYSFNKAHAACYALIAYRTAWLKANHPKEYMAALISSVMNTKDRVPFYVNACREMGIDVLPPDVNSSQQDFAVVGGVIHFGLNAVKNVGETAAEAIVRVRAEGGPFESIWELTERVDPQVLNKRALESLVKCGALDSTGATRMGMLAALEAALGHGQRISADRLAGQASIFDGAFGEDEQHVDVQHPPLATTEFDERELLRLEKETLGLYVSEHPLERVRAELRRKTDCALTDLERRRDGEFVTVGGIVSGLKQVTTKRGEPMVFVTLDDPTGSAEVVVFNSTYAAARELLEPDRVLVVKGRVDHKQAGETKLVASEVSAFEFALIRSEVRLRIDARQAPAGLIRELATLVADFPGDAPVYLALETSLGERTLALGPEYRVKPEADFFAEVRALLGEAARRVTRSAAAASSAASRARRRRRRTAPSARSTASSRRRKRKRRSVMTSTSNGDVAVTVAVRGLSVSSAISPNQSPGPSSAIFASLRHPRGAVDEYEELAARSTFACQNRSLAEVDLVGGRARAREARPSSSLRTAGPSSGARSWRHGVAPLRHPKPQVTPMWQLDFVHDRRLGFRVAGGAARGVWYGECGLRYTCRFRAGVVIGVVDARRR